MADMDTLMKRGLVSANQAGTQDKPNSICPTCGQYINMNKPKSSPTPDATEIPQTAGIRG